MTTDISLCLLLLSSTASVVVQFKVSSKLLFGYVSEFGGPLYLVPQPTLAPWAAAEYVDTDFHDEGETCDESIALGICKHF